MGSETLPAYKLPVIDFSSKDLLTKGTSLWTSTRENVVRALEEYGGFEMIYDNEVSRELKGKIYPVFEEIFDLPMETKLKYTFSDFALMDGYSKPPPQYPLRESMSIREPMILDKVQEFTNLMWPASGNEFVCETLNSYSKQLVDMDKMVKGMVFEHFGVEKYLDRHMEFTSYLLRCTKYKEPMNDEKEVTLCPHVDPGVLTILQQNEVNGLQIQAKDETWFDFVPSSPSSFIVLAGYGLMAWSNGKIHAPLHQVATKGENVRYSAIMFTFLDDIIQTPEEMLDEEKPVALFKPTNNLQSLLSFLKAKDAKQVNLNLNNQLTA